MQRPDGRSTKMLGVRNKGISIETFREQPLAESNRLIDAHLVHSRLQPVRFRSFDHESGPVRVETVCLEGKPTPFGFLEVEREGIELLSRSQPDESVLANLNIGPENPFMFSGVTDEAPSDATTRSYSLAYTPDR